LSGDLRPHVEQILVGFAEGGAVGVVHRFRRKLLDQRDSVLDKRKILRAEILRVGEAVLVQIFDQVLTMRAGEKRVVDGLLIKLVGLRIDTNKVQRQPGQRFIPG
jgi:hypothetical protein